MDYLALEKYGSGAVEVDDLVFIPDAGEEQARAHRRNTLETQPTSCARPTEVLAVVKGAPEDDADDDEVDVAASDGVRIEVPKGKLRLIDRVFTVGDVVLDRRKTPSQGEQHLSPPAREPGVNS